MKYNINKDFNRCKIMRIPFCSLILYLSRVPQDIMFKLTKIPQDIKSKKYTLDNKLNVYQVPFQLQQLILPFLLQIHISLNLKIYSSISNPSYASIYPY